MTVPVPFSQTDAYAPEPSAASPVKLRLRFSDNSTIELNSDQRVLSQPHLLLIYRDKTFIYRGTDGNFRLYREAAFVVVE